ncbi:hypothetical protein [Pectobacterium brasiliense]|uniref:hypothetical protein n=1 Tax=Pectobacterium brasiliense TaxID=180957 RepID=UPI001F080904|nr:hypothetical protein [Pectobacterium brasiliense]
MTEILQALANADGLTLREIEEHTNLRHGQIEKVLKFLSVDSPAPVIKIDKKWRRTPIPYQMDRGRIAHLTGQREREWQEMQAYLAETDCKMTFLRRALDDNDPTPCGSAKRVSDGRLLTFMLIRSLLLSLTHSLDVLKLSFHRRHK